MEKVDIAIGVVGLVALAATLAGVAFYDDGASDYAVSTGTTDLETKGPQDAASTVTFTWPAPENAFGASFDIGVTAGGIANPSGTVVIGWVLTLPDGTTVDGSSTFAHGDGTGAATASAIWGSVPEDFRGTADEADDARLVWSEPIKLQVTVDGPGSSPLPLPTGADTYEVTVSGYADTFTIGLDLPETETA